MEDDIVGFDETAPRPINETPIYAHRYCSCCQRQMLPAARVVWNVHYGARHVHVCKECGEIFVESERGGQTVEPLPKIKRFWRAWAA